MPDLVIRNARVYTLDRAVPWAEAVAVRDGRISWVGADGDAGDLVRPGTEVIDAGGRLVQPTIQWNLSALRRGEAYSASTRLFHPWKREKSPASHALRSPGVLKSQSGRISLVTTRRSCQRSTMEGRPQNQ